MMSLSLTPLLSAPFSLPHHFHAFSSPPLSLINFKPITIKPTPCLPTTTQHQPLQHDDDDDEEEDFQVLTATRSQYNNILILQSPNSKVLLLDDSGNVHSLLYTNSIFTNSYWDEFITLPPIIPHGPLAIFGLGGGTVAHQLLHFWPSLHIHGWELDDILVDKAREFLGLSDLEASNEHGGILGVCVGDALSSMASVEGGYAGIVVDLFSDAKVLPQLEKVETWVEMSNKLMPNGRIMVNCGGATNENGEVDKWWEVNGTIQALCGAFGGNLVNWKKMGENQSGNYMAFTGPLPQLETWSASVPHQLSSAVKLWTTCQSSP